MKADLVVTRRYVHPGFKLPQRLYRKIGNVVIVGSIIDNVLTQRTADGGELKPNPPKYRDQKRMAGYDVGGNVLSLVAKEHRFTSPASWKVTASSVGVKVRAKAQSFADIVENVQKRGYLGWFGINRNGMQALRALIRQFALERLRKAQG